MNKTILITGANAGIGKEIARQVALNKDTEKIYLACRNETKALAARKELEQKTGRSIFEIIVLDVSDLSSVRKGVQNISTPIDALIMNAGGMGGKTPGALNKEGVTELFATNVLGHVLLLEELLISKKINNIALFVGSEAARGVSKMGMPAPNLKTSSVDEFATLINGQYFGNKFDPMLAYGPAKYVGVMWMASLSRKYPNIKFITVSPGGTRGTNVANDMPPVKRFFMNKIAMPYIMPLMGMSHTLEKGAARLVDGINDPSLQSGVFYGSKKNVLTGTIVDQSEIFEDLKNPEFQDNAYEAIHRFIK